MNQFTASNGISIEARDGALISKWPNTHDHLKISVGDTEALREFFRAEQDERLERWRFPELPWLLVYHWGQPTAAGVVVLDEGSGAASRVIHRNADPDNESPDYRAARAYFDAHPEPKPWHNAQPGEIWALKFGVSEDEEIVQAKDSFFVNLAVSDRWFDTTGKSAPEITAGRRIYPEVTE